MAKTSFKIGDKVKARQDIERFPHGIVEEGSIGTIVQHDGDMTSVKMDDYFPWLEEWENCLHFYRGTDELYANLELIPQPTPTNDEILAVLDSLPTGAIMTGNRITVACDVSKLLGATVSPDQIDSAIMERRNNRKNT